MDKDELYIHNGIVLSHEKNEILSFMTTWMALEGVMLSKITTREEDKYCMISLTFRT